MNNLSNQIKGMLKPIPASVQFAEKKGTGCKLLSERSHKTNKINVTVVAVMFSSSFISTSPFRTFVLCGTLPVYEEQ
jgi:hypothetical protein